MHPSSPRCSPSTLHFLLMCNRKRLVCAFLPYYRAAVASWWAAASAGCSKPLCGSLRSGWWSKPELHYTPWQWQHTHTVKSPMTVLELLQWNEQNDWISLISTSELRHRQQLLNDCTKISQSWSHTWVSAAAQCQTQQVPDFSIPIDSTKHAHGVQLMNLWWDMSHVSEHGSFNTNQTAQLHPLQMKLIHLKFNEQ